MNVLLRSIDWKEAGLGLVLLGALVWSSFHSYLFFHTFAELFSIIIAYGVFMLAWNTRRMLNNDYLLFVGIAYFFVAFLDLLHTLAYKGMPVFPGYNDNNLPPQIWIVARYMESLALLAAPIFFRRKLPVWPTMAGFIAVTTLSLVSIFHWRNFPDCWVNGVGLTPFKVTSEYVISVILIGASYLLWKNRRRFDPLVLRYLILSLAATIITELCFTAYTHLYATINMVGHVFKILSFYFMYRAIIETGLTKPYDLLFRDLQLEIEERRRAEELLDRTQKAGGVGGFELRQMDGRLRLTSQSKRILGLPDNAAPSAQEVYELFVPEDRLALMSAFEASGETGESFEVQARLAGEPGGERWLRFAGGVEDQAGRTVLAGIIHDVTDSRRLERLREDIDRMSRHDLKSPLSGIIGLPGLILSDPDMPRATIDEFLGLIRQTGYKMLNLINVSLDMFKMEQGTYAFEPKPVDVAAVFGRLGQESAGKLSSRQLTLQIDGDGQGGPFEVMAEDLPCWSMFGNLLENAVEASPKGGVVTVRFSREAGMGKVAISNKGPVPEDVRHRFFEKYATSGKPNGTGLGTYSASLIARTLGGSIALDTDSDPEGTTVTVSLPLA